MGAVLTVTRRLEKGLGHGLSVKVLASKPPQDPHVEGSSCRFPSHLHSHSVARMPRHAPNFFFLSL